jgi:hypothetical protein
MLILDKQKAVERIVALTADEAAPPQDEEPAVRKTHARTYHRVATYERRQEPRAAEDGPAARRPAERRKRRLRPATGGALG